MKLNLKDELAKLSSTKPNLAQSDDEFSDQGKYLMELLLSREETKTYWYLIKKKKWNQKETRAKVDYGDGEFEEELEFKVNDNKRIRAPIGDLADFGKRYKGKSTSRKKIDDEEEEEEEEADEDIEDDEEDEEDEDDDDEEEEEEDEEEEDEEEEDDEEVETKPKKQKTSSAASYETNLKIVNMDQKEDVAKGKAVKTQLSNSLSWTVLDLFSIWSQYFFYCCCLCH